MTEAELTTLAASWHEPADRYWYNDDETPHTAHNRVVDEAAHTIAALVAEVRRLCAAPDAADARWATGSLTATHVIVGGRGYDLRESAPATPAARPG